MSIMIGSIKVSFEVKKDVSWLEVVIPIRAGKVELNIRHAPLSEAGQSLTLEISLQEGRVDKNA
jgi:hypothetical protein